MHSAIKANQVDELLAHDPYEAANDNIAELQTSKTTQMPAHSILSWMVTNGHIGMDERDAGDHLAKLASIARSPLRGLMVKYTARTADRKWKTIEVQRHTIRGTLDDLVASIRYDPRRKATVQAFVVEETNIDLDNPHRVAQGLADVSRYLWGTSATVTPIIIAANDNLAVANTDEEPEIPANRILDGFDRMHSRGQLDDDKEVNTALHAAGVRYQQDHHMAGLSPLGAIDYSRVTVDYGSSEGMGDRMMKARDGFRTARTLLGDRYGKVVDAVCLNGRTLVDIGLAVTGQKSPPAASSAAKERLNAGLRLLAVHYGIMKRIA